MRERLRYEALRSLLDKNGRALQLLSDLEVDLNHFLPWDRHVRGLLHRLGEEILLMAQEVNLLSGGRHADLYPPILRIADEIEGLMQTSPERTGAPLVVKLSEELAADPGVAGGKTAGVALLARLFPDSVPPGFAVTTLGYRRFLEEEKLADRIRLLLSDIDFVVGRDLFRARTLALRDLIRASPVPPEVEQSILRHTAELPRDRFEAGWAVRSSAIGEDGRHSFAGQFDSRLNVAPDDLVQAYKSVLASRFTDRAVIYRLHCGLCR
jgi:pyruvate,water dikinase